ncbi:DNA-directed DNA polymerase [Tanacetum coccineum]
MEPSMEEYMTKTQDDYGPGIVRLKIDEKAHFKLKGQFLKELRDNTFSGSDNEDANEHIEKVLETVDLFYIPDVTQDQIMLRVFPMSLTGDASRWLRNEPASSSMKAADAKKAIEEMADHSKKWHNGTSTRTRSIETSDGLAAIQAQLNNLGREIKNVNEKFNAAQVGCETYKGPHYTKDCSLKEEATAFEDAYYTQFGVPFPLGGRHRAAAPGFYQRDNRNPSYKKRRQTMEESMSKFMFEYAKRHVENSNLIKEIRSSTDGWVDELPNVLWAHHTSLKQSNGETPFSLTHRSEAVIPVELGMPTYRTMMIREDENKDELRLNMDLLQERREATTIREAKYKAKMEQYYNQRVRLSSLKPDEYVFWRNEASRVEDQGKLGPKWEGPYKVTEVYQNGSYKLQTIKGREVPQT